MKGRKPDFLIIGAMRCGTTSLHDYLGKHPEIYTTNPKEIHFFDDKNFDKGLLNAYYQHFISEKKNLRNITTRLYEMPSKKL